MKLFTNMLPIIKSKTVVMQIRFSLVLPVLWLIQICLIFVGSSGCHDTETANSIPPTSAKQIRKLINRLSSSQSKEVQNIEFSSGSAKEASSSQLNRERKRKEASARNFPTWIPYRILYIARGAGIRWPCPCPQAQAARN